MRWRGKENFILHVLDLILALIALATLALQTRRLPLQNVVAIAFVIAVGSSVLEILNVGLRFSLGKPASVHDAQEFSLELASPFLWMIFLLSAREAARRMLFRLREKPNYGLWLIGLASLISAALWFAVEYFETKEIAAAQWKVFFGKWLFSLILLIVLTPWMIRKKPA